MKTAEARGPGSRKSALQVQWNRVRRLVPLPAAAVPQTGVLRETRFLPHHPRRLCAPRVIRSMISTRPGVQSSRSRRVCSVKRYRAGKISVSFVDDAESAKKMKCPAVHSCNRRGRTLSVLCLDQSKLLYDTQVLRSSLEYCFLIRRHMRTSIVTCSLCRCPTSWRG